MRFKKSQAVAAALLLTACAKDPVAPASAPAPAATDLVLHVQSIAGLNPGADGQPAPVRVRLFELKSAAVFARADYFALADKAQATLGSDLIGQDEVLIQPGEYQKVTRPLNSATRQLGLVVGYRELDRAVWREVIPVSPGHGDEIQISLDVRAVRSAPVVAP
ncbi:MAG: type VI secretion system lipoprotein TssJ [Janthinobacterium lividum]|uniref:type VI secretion system lipoprotein TssJ n=1 Tax=Pseudomonas sp. MWU16-30317 TaxID=2878095 RepID=UPI001CFA633A|nr:type VI secretion system lipoprotein TssJ [Pseudomonas sp. MWU16-30317]